MKALVANSGLRHLGLGTGLDRKQRDYLTKVHSSAQNLLGIINDILDFSKIEAGELDTEAVDFDLAEVLDHLANVVSVKSGEKELELIVDLDPEVPLGLKGDPLRLNQILINLANNAIKFTEAGEITISARLVEQAEAERVKGFLVKPVSPSSLYDAILEAMGHGREHVSPTGGAVPAQAQLRGARVLLAEDNEINQQVAEELLGQAGIHVTIANHGREGVETLAARPADFDGVLMDIQMPVLDGYAATQEIREDARFEALPVIAMTANAMAGDREKALAAGMNDHVAKPIDVAELFEVLGRWVQVPEGRRLPESQALEEPEAVAEEASSLPALPGVDVQSGLARVGGKVAVYRKILRQFANSQADASARIRSVLASGDTVTAEREAHILKGVAGNIGADEVQAAAKRLEAAIRQGADAEALIAALDGTLGELVESLTSLIAAPDPAGVAPVQGEAPDLVPQFDRLKTLLEDYDGGAVELVSEIESQAALTEFARPLRKIAESIDDFEFDEALELLNALREGMGLRTSDSATLT